MIYIFSVDTRNNGILKNTLNSTNVIDYSHKNSYDYMSFLRHFRCSKKGDDGGRRGGGRVVEGLSWKRAGGLP